MKQLSLVAFYGEKGRPLAGLLDRCRSVVDDSLPGGAFNSYQAAQIHATIVGMEGLPGEPRVNRNLWSKRGLKALMKFSSLAEVVGRSLPLSVRYGGFDPGDRRFDSRGRAPYERSFQIDRSSGRATLIGWPHVDGNFGLRYLERLRDDLAEECNLEHKYDGDNDLYLVLGIVRPPVDHARASSAELAVREYLRANPLDVRLALEELSVVRYLEETLDPSTTVAHHLADSSLTPDALDAWCAS
jgi:hypothetical protein